MKKIITALVQLGLLWLFFYEIFILIKIFFKEDSILIFGFFVGFLFLIFGIQGLCSSKKKLRAENLDDKAKEKIKKKIGVNWNLIWGGTGIILVAIYSLIKKG